MKEGTHLTLKDGREILLQDDEDILLSIRSSHETLCSYPFTCPSGGYGGGTLLLSPSEQYLIFSFFSGESEEGFSLFRIEDSRLVPLFESEYFCGEGASYLFSDDEGVLFQSLLGGFGPWYLEDAERDENGVSYFQYGEIDILDVGSKSFSRHDVRVYPSESWKAEIDGPSDISKITGGNTLHIAMPWGEETLTLPLADTIVFRPE
ncbi:hypothetical protein D7V91_03420 [bacterium 1xD42-67]|nr:hypothetical protein D7V91_03420 [bacterium 1xD42-67]